MPVCAWVVPRGAPAAVRSRAPVPLPWPRPCSKAVRGPAKFFSAAALPPPPPAPPPPAPPAPPPNRFGGMLFPSAVIGIRLPRIVAAKPCCWVRNSNWSCLAIWPLSSVSSRSSLIALRLLRDLEREPAPLVRAPPDAAPRLDQRRDQPLARLSLAGDVLARLRDLDVEAQSFEALVAPLSDALLAGRLPSSRLCPLILTQLREGARHRDDLRP